MSNTKECIDKVWESEQDYRLRRVKHVINEMNEAGETIKPWKILRTACIKKEFEMEVNGYINSVTDT